VSTVLLTDRAWADDRIERQTIEAAGHQLIPAAASAVTAGEVEARIRRYSPAAVLTCWAPVTADAIAAAPNLKIVARLGVGLDNIAVDAATQRSVWVSNVPDYCTEEVSDHALALILAWTRGIVTLSSAIKSGVWNPANAKLRRLAVLTVGLFGYGRIGKRLGEKLAPFGCRILAHVRSSRPVEPDVCFVELDEMLQESDIVVLVAPLSDSTRKVINHQRLDRMRPGSLLVNVSRGALVDTTALSSALEHGPLGGAALDVLDEEPLVPEALRQSGRVIMTPHVAFSSDTSIAELRLRAAQDVVRVLQGDEPINPCNRLTVK
jgi:D-3-phosphoglycerate dehydrogenase / 2-oxoglutarate reductase